jgi:hypothetical protein
MRSDLAVYTTIYPGVEPFLGPWSASLAAQTDQDFDLWVGLDGVAPTAAAALLDGGIAARATWVAGPTGATAAEVRQLALARIVERYAFVVLVDSDDLLLDSRIARARVALAECDVAGCALDVVDAAGERLGIVFGGDVRSDFSALLPRYNVFGLSNTAYRCDLLRRCLPIPSGTVVIDWLLVTRALALGAGLGFDSRPGMAYRQHGRNTAEVVPPFSEAFIRRAAGLVVAHHDAVRAGGCTPPGELAAALDEAAQAAGAFRRAIAEPPCLTAYAVALRALPARHVWWWPVAHPDLEDVWRN